jgi:hypothetical protein
MEENKSLQETQQWMMDMLINPFPPGADEDVEGRIAKGPRLSARRHLQIYRQSYIVRLRECMKKQFAALAYTLGEELFIQFADEYLSRYPSDSYSLNTLGKRFPAFLQENRPDGEEAIKEDWCDFMIDLASFEYELTVLFDEAEPEDGKPLFRIFKHHHNIARYFLEFSKGKAPELYESQTSYCKVSRDNYRLTIQEITEEEFGKAGITTPSHAFIGHP